MANALDWAKVWADVDEWYQAAHKKERCKHCGHLDHYYPDWDDQQNAIEKMVNKQLSKKRSAKP